MTATPDLAFSDPIGKLVSLHALQKGYKSLGVDAYDLVDENNPLLKAKCEPFDFANPIVDPAELAMRLSETMLKHNGIGLAAPQVGINTRVFVMRTNPITVVFNPRIVDYVGETALYVEGCISFTGLAVKVKRYQGVRVRYARVDGEIVTDKLAGLSARVFQHEFDHLEGVLFFNRASRYHRDQAFKKRVK